jgi:hypothetical protein
VLSVVFLVLGLGAAVVMAIVAVLLVVAYDTCAVTSCNYAGFNLGWFVAMLAPPLAYTVGLVATIVRLRRRRVAFWVPLVTSVVSAALFYAGAQIVFISVPGSGF